MLLVRYGVLDAYHDIPLTTDELLNDDYTLMVHDEELNVDFYAYKEDPRVSIGVDTYGNIAGVRVSVCGSCLNFVDLSNLNEYCFGRCILVQISKTRHFKKSYVVRSWG